MADENLVIVRTNSGVFYTEEFYATPVEFERPLWKDCNDGLPMGDIPTWKWNRQNPLVFDWDNEILYLATFWWPGDSYNTGLWKMNGLGDTWVQKFTPQNMRTLLDASGYTGTPLASLGYENYISMLLAKSGRLLMVAGGAGASTSVFRMTKAMFFSDDQLATLELGGDLEVHSGHFCNMKTGMLSESADGRILVTLESRTLAGGIGNNSTALGVSDDDGESIYDGGNLWFDDDHTSENFSIARNGEDVYFYSQSGQYSALRWCVSAVGGYPFTPNDDYAPDDGFLRYSLGPWSDRSYVACSQLDPLKLMGIVEVASAGVTKLSDDGGENWAATGENQGGAGVCMVPTKAGGWIVARAQTGPDDGINPNEYIMYSDDDGETWQNKSGNIGQAGFMDLESPDENAIFQILTQGAPTLAPGTFLSSVALLAPGTTGTFLADTALGEI